MGGGGGDGKAHGDPHIPLSGTNGSDIKEVMVRYRIDGHSTHGLILRS